MEQKLVYICNYDTFTTEITDELKRVLGDDISNWKIVQISATYNVKDDESGCYVLLEKIN